MKKKILLFAIMLVLGNSIFAQEESSVRYTLADITLGGPLSYYQQRPNEISNEAVKRWKDGVRVTNSDSFERKIVDGSWKITYKGTNRNINGLDVELTTDIKFDEASVRYTLADITLGGPLSYYQQRPNEISNEAVKRWKDGVRVTNPDSFERKIVDGSWKITYKGTNRNINGMDVKLNK